VSVNQSFEIRFLVTLLIHQTDKLLDIGVEDEGWAAAVEIINELLAIHEEIRKFEPEIYEPAKT